MPASAYLTFFFLINQLRHDLYVYKFVCCIHMYEGESISNQPNLFPVVIHFFFFNVIAL